MKDQEDISDSASSDESEDEFEISDLQPATETGQCWLRPLHIPRLSRHQQRWSLLLTALLMVLIIGGILTSVVNIPVWISQNVLVAQPTVSSVRGQIYLLSNPNWGHFFIDGQPLVHPPAVGTDPPLSLPQGEHQITWQATMFTSRTCLLDIHSSTQITTICPSGTRMLDQTVVNHALVISFFATLTDLQQDQRDNLVAHVQAFLASSTASQNMQAGEFYAQASKQPQAPACQRQAAATLCYTQAQQPLVATLHIQPDINPPIVGPCGSIQSCSTSLPDCRLFCGSSSVSPISNSWRVVTFAQLLWNYTTPSGQVVGINQPDSFVYSPNNDIEIALDITYNAQNWEVHFSPTSQEDLGNLVCTQAMNDAQGLLNITPSTYQSRAISPPDQRGSCVIVETSTNSAGTPQPQTGSAYLLESCGVLLAANDFAHTLWPYLPQANATQVSSTQALVEARI